MYALIFQPLLPIVRVLLCIDQIKLTVSVRSQDGTEVVRVVVADENVPLFKYILVSGFEFTLDKPLTLSLYCAGG